MYEKYTGLPDTSVSGSKRKAAGSRDAGKKRSRDIHSEDIYPERDTREAAIPARSNSGRSRTSGLKKKLRNRRIAVSVAGVVIIGLIVLAVVVLFRSCQDETLPVETPDVATDTYRLGVSVNGIDISGMSLDEARAAVTPGLQYTFSNIAITLQTDAFSERITGEDMDVASNLEELLMSALAGGAEKAYYTAITFDYNALDARIAEINEGLATGPTEASFSVDFGSSGKPEFTYTPGTPGYGLDIKSTEEMVRQALEKNDLQAILTPQLTTVEPTVTVDDIKAHTSLIGKFSTTYRAEAYDGLSEEQTVILENRAFNIDKGAKLLNNLTVKPGETVSFNEVVGDRTEERGWKLANAIIFGNQYTLEAGGGICQVSTTLYGALLRANIQIVSRREHSFPSDYVDKGLDATVDTGHIDFKFKNDTEYPLYIFAYVTRNKSSNRKRDLTVAIYGEALPAGVTYQPRTVLVEEIPQPETEYVYDKKKTVEYDEIEISGRKGYIIDVYLDKLVNGKTESSELLYQDEYAAVAERRRVGTLPLPTVTPAATASPDTEKVTPAPGTEEMP